MDHFSVLYQGFENTLQEERKIYRIVDEQCGELFKIMNTVSLQPTLWGHGYTDKLWEAYSRICTISSYVGRMQNGLGKVFDKYMEYEQKVLAEAEEDITVKNGFAKGSVREAKAAVREHIEFEEKNQKASGSLKDALYEGTVGSWKRNWGQTLAILEGTKVVSGEGYTVLRDNFYENLESSDLPSFVTGAIKKLIGKAEGTVSDYMDIVQGILDFTDPESREEAFLAVVDILDPTDLGAEDVVESVFDITTNDSPLMQHIDEVQQLTVDAVQEGNYLEAAVTFIGGGFETVAKGTTEVGMDWITAQVDGKLGSATELIMGEKIKLEDIWEIIANHTGVNLGTIVADIGSDISGGISSTLDGFADWLGGMKEWKMK